MSQRLLPPIWLIILIAGLPQLTETVYTPSLPEITRDLSTSAEMVEYTLTVYLFGFAVGTLFWGKLSDKIGRKPCVIMGLIIFIIGCVGCYNANSINLLLVSRLVQALGGSIGSVIGQAICRDAFHGADLGRAYSAIGTSLAIFPAIGPTIGGLIAESYGWPYIFLFLIIFAIFLNLVAFVSLPETHSVDKRQSVSIKEVALSLINDKKVIGYGLIVGGCNGISFSYFAEGSFFLIELLGLSPSQYGLSFIVIAFSTMLGGLYSRRLLKTYTPNVIMEYSLKIMLTSTSIFLLLICSNNFILLSQTFLIYATILSQMVIMFAFCMATSNALAVSLVNYKWCIGTASSLLGFFYYCITSLVTLGMGLLHNGTLIPMPLYFALISLLMLIVYKKIIKD